MKINKRLIKQSRQADLYAYFQQRGYELRKEGGKGHYRVVGYQGLIIKGNMFYQFGTGEKGNSVDCLVNVLGLGFQEAVGELVGVPGAQVETPVIAKWFELPARAQNMKRVFAYLCQTRCVDKGVVSSLVKEKLLYQDTKGNCVFVWLEDRKAVGGEIIGTLAKVRYKGVAKGSKYARGFEVRRGAAASKLYFFESAIDLLSFMVLQGGCSDLDNAFFISMAGLKAAVVDYYVDKYKVEPVICVDNDEAGRGFAETFLAKGAQVLRPKYKDWNEDLFQATLGKGFAYE